MIVDATDAKNRFGQYVTAAMRQPVVIRKSGREVAVILSREEYDRLTALEDRWLAHQAEEAESEGYLGPEETRKFLAGKLNDE